MKRKRQLLIGHHMLGYKVGSVRGRKGQGTNRLIVLERAPGRLELVTGDAMQPATLDDARHEASLDFMSAVDRALFLGVDAQEIVRIVESLLEAR